MRGKPYLVRSLALSGISPNLDGKTLVSGSRPQSGRWAVLVGMRQTHHIKDNAFRMCKAPLLHGSGQNFKEYVLTYPAPPAHPRILQSRRTGSALLVSSPIADWQPWSIRNGNPRASKRYFCAHPACVAASSRQEGACERSRMMRPRAKPAHRSAVLGSALRRGNLLQAERRGGRTPACEHDA